MSGIRLDSNAHKIVHMTRLLLSSIFFLAGLTEERTKSLKIWLTGIEEEDACQGSVKRKN